LIFDRATGFDSVNLYFQDESRFGLFTRNGKMLTARGIKPECKFQQVFKSTYVYGAFSPLTGHMFCLELPFCNGENFQIYLDEFSKENPHEFKIVVLDNGAFHKAKSLKIPLNIGLIFLPPYSPELNPAEKVWLTLKRNFTNRLFSNLEQLSLFISNALSHIKPDNIKSICNFNYIFSNLNWTI
jgi:transposase